MTTEKRKSTYRGGNIAVAVRFRQAVALNNARSAMASGRGALIEAENRSQLMALLQEGLHAGASIKANANLFGICSRTLKRWGIAINAHGFSVDRCKSYLCNKTEMHEFESGQLVRDFFERVCRDEGINKVSALILHPDKGAPIRSFTLVSKMVEMGVSLSFSRPRLSDDNAFTELIFSHNVDAVQRSG